MDEETPDLREMELARLRAELIDSFERQAKDLRSRSARDLVAATFRAFAASARSIDQFSSWVLAATGAFGALLVGSLDNLVATIGRDLTEWALLLLLLSLSAGVIVKWRAFSVFMQEAGRQAAVDQFGPAFEAYERDETELLDRAASAGIHVETDIAPREIAEKVVSAFPWGMRRFVRKAFESAIAGVDSGNRKLAKTLVQLAVFQYLQVLLALASVGCIVAGL